MISQSVLVLLSNDVNGEIIDPRVGKLTFLEASVIGDDCVLSKLHEEYAPFVVYKTEKGWIIKDRTGVIVVYYPFALHENNPMFGYYAKNIALKMYAKWERDQLSESSAVPRARSSAKSL